MSRVIITIDALPGHVGFDRGVHQAIGLRTKLEDSLHIIIRHALSFRYGQPSATKRDQ
jgi:hypothetical protein